MKSKELPKSKFDNCGGDKNLVDVIGTQVHLKNPNTKWDEIAGQEEGKYLLEHALGMPLFYPKLFKGALKPWKSVLMFGPKGNGKTMLAKAAATECKTEFFYVPAEMIVSRYKNKSEQFVCLLFKMARFYAPTIIFIDEIDLFCLKPNAKVKSEFLLQMDDDFNNENPSKIVMVLAATSAPWNIDENLRRRFERRIYIQLPNTEERKALLKMNLKDVNKSPDLVIEDITNQLNGFSFADINYLCRNAYIIAAARQIDSVTTEEIKKHPKFEPNFEVTKNDFNKSIKNMNNILSADDLEKFDKYERWNSQFGLF